MTLELIIFIASILFGMFLYWRESGGNGLYRFFNKIFNAKALQMKPDDKKGFVYQQSFVLRLVFIGTLFLIGILIVRFLIPIDLATISLFASMVVGTLVGTYLAGFIFKSEKVIDAKADSIEDVLHETLEKGKTLIDELQGKEDVQDPEINESKTEHPAEEEKKSARERLKDKGLL
ncbi:hypothetical protein [Snuella lapsa]|uniref:Uncharacterized protein n=1 Tax=Snuella lapsa TaxID=870481 RepID=A0ABP6YES1_9FLAO